MVARLPFQMPILTLAPGRDLYRSGARKPLILKHRGVCQILSEHPHAVVTPEQMAIHHQRRHAIDAGGDHTVGIGAQLGLDLIG